MARACWHVPTATARTHSAEGLRDPRQQRPFAWLCGCSAPGAATSTRPQPRSRIIERGMSGQPLVALATRQLELKNPAQGAALYCGFTLCTKPRMRGLTRSGASSWGQLQREVGAWGCETGRRQRLGRPSPACSPAAPAVQAAASTAQQHAAALRPSPSPAHCPTPGNDTNSCKEAGQKAARKAAVRELSGRRAGRRMRRPVAVLAQHVCCCRRPAGMAVQSVHSPDAHIRLLRQLLKTVGWPAGGQRCTPPAAAAHLDGGILCKLATPLDLLPGVLLACRARQGAAWAGCARGGLMRCSAQCRQYPHTVCCLPG